VWDGDITEKDLPRYLKWMRDYSDEEFAEFIANSAPIPFEDGTLTGDRNLRLSSK